MNLFRDRFCNKGNLLFFANSSLCDSVFLNNYAIKLKFRHKSNAKTVIHIYE